MKLAEKRANRPHSFCKGSGSGGVKRAGHDQRTTKAQEGVLRSRGLGTYYFR